MAALIVALLCHSPANAARVALWNKSKHKIVLRAQWVGPGSKKVAKTETILPWGKGVIESIRFAMTFWVNGHEKQTRRSLKWSEAGKYHYYETSAGTPALSSQFGRVSLAPRQEVMKAKKAYEKGEQSFKFFVASDLHYTESGAPAATANATKMVAALRANATAREKIEALFICGDLVDGDKGDPKTEAEKARRIARFTAQMNQFLIKFEAPISNQLPIHVALGNHDVYGPGNETVANKYIRDSLAGTNLLGARVNASNSPRYYATSILKPTQKLMLGGKTLSEKYPTPPNPNWDVVPFGGPHAYKDIHGVRFFVLGLGPAAFLVPGYRKGTTRWLARQLAVTGKKTPVVVVMHYNLFDDWNNWIPDVEKAAFLKVIKGYNVLAIFTGHNHVASAAEINGVPVYIVGTSRYLVGRYDSRTKKLTVRDGT